MASVVMYATRACPFCKWARDLLDGKGVDYIEISVDGQPQLRREMREKSGSNTVPQIFIEGVSVGGFTDINALDQIGKLDELLEK